MRTRGHPPLHGGLGLAQIDPEMLEARLHRCARCAQRVEVANGWSVGARGEEGGGGGSLNKGALSNRFKTQAGEESIHKVGQNSFQAQPQGLF